MVDTPTTRNRFRKQEVGTNNNVWGTYLNEVFDCVDQVVDGVESINLGGATSYTLTTSDYTTSDQAKNRVLVCSNVNAVGSDLVLPAVEHVYGIVNNGSADITPAPSGGTGPDIPAGRMTWIYCDGTNAYSLASTTLPVAFSPVNANDPTTKDYVDTAIATAGLPATAGTVLVSGSDTTAGYLGQKIAIQSASLTTTQLAALSSVQIGTPGGDEDVLIGAPFVGGFLNGGLQSSSFTPVVGYAYDLDATSASSTVDLSGMTTPQVGQEFKLNKFGSLPVCLLGTVNSNSNPIRTDTFNTVLRYCGASWGWNIMTSSGGGIHFTDPWEFLPRVFVAANLLLEENDGTDRTSATTAFFTAMAARGFQDTTNWTADTYKTLLTVSSGKGFLAALVGPTAGGSETTTFEITADGVTTEIAVAVASGERAVLSRVCLPGPTYTTASRFAIQGGTIDSGKTTIGTPGIDTLLGGWPLVEANGVPCLKFTQSLVIRAKHSANITNSTATAYSGGMYRLGL